MTPQTIDNTRKKKIFSAWKVLLPILIGLTVVVMMFMHDAKKEDLGQVWANLHFDTRAILCIILAFIFMFGRDFGLSWRFRTRRPSR